jgi:hypothetical protein
VSLLHQAIRNLKTDLRDVECQYGTRFLVSCLLPTAFVSVTPRTDTSFHSGYNPPQFVLDAAKDALDRVDCNQYAPTRVNPPTKDFVADRTDLWTRDALD